MCLYLSEKKLEEPVRNGTAADFLSIPSANDKNLIFRQNLDLKVS